MCSMCMQRKVGPLLHPPWLILKKLPTPASTCRCMFSGGWSWSFKSGFWLLSENKVFGLWELWSGLDVRFPKTVWLWREVHECTSKRAFPRASLRERVDCRPCALVNNPTFCALAPFSAGFCSVECWSLHRVSRRRWEGSHPRQTEQLPSFVDHSVGNWNMQVVYSFSWDAICEF